MNNTEHLDRNFSELNEQLKKIQIAMKVTDEEIFRPNFDSIIIKADNYGSFLINVDDVLTIDPDQNNIILTDSATFNALMRKTLKDYLGIMYFGNNRWGKDSRNNLPADYKSNIEHEILYFIEYISNELF